MRRKSKRMALYEAIRQGQAKIAQGLENGQMRSDASGQQKVQKQPVPQPGSRQRLVAKSALFETKETSQSLWASPLTVKIALAGGAIVVVLLVVSLFSMLFKGEQPTQPVAQQPSDPVTPQYQPIEQVTPEKQPVKVVEAPIEEKKTGIFGFGGKKEPKKEEPVAKSTEPVIESSVGKNVIVIASIPESRQGELGIMREFFANKAIPTEVIINDSGYAMLVTRQGFVQNPANAGTNGYQLLQKIKQLGLVYQQETGDTNWGDRAFQGAYGYKRLK